MQQLLPADLRACVSFAVQFLARMDVDNEWPLHLQDSVTMQNCTIWVTVSSFQLQLLPLQSENVTVWCGKTEKG